MTRQAILLGMALLLSAGVLASDQQPNRHIQIVLDHLAKRSYDLPKGDFVLLARQPMGISGSSVIYDLDAAQLVIVPGADSKDGVERRSIGKQEVQLMRELMSIDSIRSLPRDSGTLGFDGSAFVAVIRLGNSTKYIGHWSPKAKAVVILSSIYELELRSKRPRTGL